MRLIAMAKLSDYWSRNPLAETALRRWAAIVKAANWQSLSDVQSSFAKAKALGGERVRFEIAGGDYRLIAAFNFRAQIAFVKFVGTHADYDRIDALTISMF